MKVVNNFPKRAYLLYSFCLAILLSLAATCVTKKPSRSSLPPSSKQVQNNGSNTAQSSLPPSKQVQNNGSNTAQSSLPSSKQVPTNNSGSEKEDQASIMSRSDTMVQEEKEYREKFSQELSTIKDLSERDNMIGSFVAKRNRRVERFNLLLKKVVDPNEKQRLIREFDDIKGMCEERNMLNDQYVGVSDPTERKKKDQKQGDIVEKYNGYPVESKRQQIRRRVEALMHFVADNPSICPNKQEQDVQCAICHSTGSVGLLPCGDYVHASCLVEEMISVWRKGYEFIFTCPGSCGNYLGFHYFLLDDEYVKKYLSLDGLKEIFFKLRGK